MKSASTGDLIDFVRARLYADHSRRDLARRIAIKQYVCAHWRTLHVDPRERCGKFRICRSSLPCRDIRAVLLCRKALLGKREFVLTGWDFVRGERRDLHVSRNQ